MPMYDFWCVDCDNEWEEISTVEARAECKCPECGGDNRITPSAFSFWCPSRERTAKQLKRRSLEHTKRTVKRHGVDALKQNETYRNVDEKWRALTRSKNHDKNTIEKFANVHKDWNPGLSRYDPPPQPKQKEG